MKEKQKRKGKRSLLRGINALVAGINLRDRESLVTVLSPVGDVTDRFSISMNREGYSLFEWRVPRGAKNAFEATGMAYPVSRTLKEMGYNDVTVAHPKELA